MNDIIELWEDLRTASRSQLRVRSVVLLGGVLAAASLVLAGAPSTLTVVGMVVLTLLAVLQPHTTAPGLILVFVSGCWWGLVPGWHWALLPAAWGLLLVHTGCALAAAVPAQADLPASLLARWARRVGVVATITALLWGLSGGLEQVRGMTNGAVPAVVALVAMIAGLAGVWRLWALREGEPPRG